jgi:hypothetical protein
MVFAKMRPLSPLELGSKTCQHTKRASGHSKELRLKSLSKLA